MELTEAEAKKLWCPQREAERCIASGCMAWRWTSMGKRAVRGETGDAPAGYCGLAGKP